jgi:hypothetical protein
MQVHTLVEYRLADGFLRDGIWYGHGTDYKNCDVKLFCHILQDVIFHNEAYSKSNSSVEASPERTYVNRPSEQPSFDAQHTPSPKRGATFVSAVISAILNAAAGSAGKRAALKNEGTVQEVQDAHGGM